MKTAPMPDLRRPVSYATPPRPPAPAPVRRDDYEERAAIMEHEGGIPTTLAEWMAALQTMPRPPMIPPKAWETFIDECSGRVGYLSELYNNGRRFQ